MTACTKKVTHHKFSFANLRFTEMIIHHMHVSFLRTPSKHLKIQNFKKTKKLKIKKQAQAGSNPCQMRMIY